MGGHRQVGEQLCCVFTKTVVALVQAKNGAANTESRVGKKYRVAGAISCLPFHTPSLNKQRTERRSTKSQGVYKQDRQTGWTSKKKKNAELTGSRDSGI